jgi:hypothetical protein
MSCFCCRPAKGDDPVQDDDSEEEPTFIQRVSSKQAHSTPSQLTFVCMVRVHARLIARSLCNWWTMEPVQDEESDVETTFTQRVNKRTPLLTTHFRPHSSSSWTYKCTITMQTVFVELANWPRLGKTRALGCAARTPPTASACRVGPRRVRLLHTWKTSTRLPWKPPNVGHCGSAAFNCHLWWTCSKNWIRWESWHSFASPMKRLFLSIIQLLEYSLYNTIAILHL